MKHFFTSFLSIILVALCAVTASAQQLPNANFENWSGNQWEGNDQPAGWYFSNIKQTAVVTVTKFFGEKVAGYNGGYAAKVSNCAVGAMGIEEVSPGWFSMAPVWLYFPGISNIGESSSGIEGGTAFTYRPDTLVCWIKRGGSATDKEDYNLVFYSWNGTSKGTSYGNKTGGCSNVGTKTNEQSDIRQALGRNFCGSTQLATQVAEGWVYEKRSYANWTRIAVPIYYFNDEVPQKCNFIVSAGCYPNHYYAETSDNGWLNEGNWIAVDNIEMKYSSAIQKLYVGGREWRGFDPTNTTTPQVYSLGQGATAIPEIYAVRGAGSLSARDNHSGSIASTNAPGRRLTSSECVITNGAVDGAPTIITITAEDGSSTTTYQIQFVSAASNNAKLADIQVNGASVSGFNAYLTSYNIALPYGTTSAPVITATAQDAGATVAITQPTSANGSATIHVTAADGSTTMTYTLNFSVAQLSDVTLLNIFVDGNPLPGFTPSKSNYTVSLPLGTTTAPAITWESAYPAGAQTITLLSNTLANGAQIQVSAPGASAAKTYKLTYRIEASSYAYLSSISLDGTPIAGFDPEVTNYSFDLPLGTTELPTISWTQGDQYQSVQMIEGGVDGTTRIVVTAAAGNTITYRLTFHTLKSANNALNAIFLDGDTLPGFDADSLTYVVTLPAGTSAMPAITYSQGDEYQTVTLSRNESAMTARIVVKAGDGSQRVYNLTFRVEKSANALLQMIYLNGEPLADFSPETMNYVVRLSAENIPAITVSASDGQQVNITTPATFGTATITVTPEEGTPAVYSIIFQSDSEPVLPDFAQDSFPVTYSALLAAIYVDGVIYQENPVPGTVYVDSLPWRTEQIPSVAPVAATKGQTITMTQRGLNDTTFIHVVSGDQTADYAIFFPVRKSHNTLLELIEVEGYELNFTSDNHNYAITLDYGTTILPQISCTKAESEQSISIHTNGIDQPATINVTAEDGTIATYTINWTMGYAPYPNNLVALVLTGVPSFDLSTGDHFVANIPYGTTELDIEAVKSYPEQQVRIERRGLLDTTIITVTADDPAIEPHVYTILPKLQDYPTLHLESVSLDGTPYAYFNPNVFDYYILTASKPAVTFTVPQGVTANLGDDTNTATKIYVSDADDEVVYTFHYIAKKGHPYSTNMTEATYNSSKINSEGEIAWADSDGFRLGGSSVSPFSGPAWNWDDKFVIIELEYGQPQSVSFEYRNNDFAATGSDWYVSESSDNQNWTEVWSNSSTNVNFQSASANLSKSTRYLKFCYTGNFAGWYHNVNIKRHPYNSALTAVSVDGNDATIDGINITYNYASPVNCKYPQLAFTGGVEVQHRSIAWGEWTANGNVATLNATITNYNADASASTDYYLTITSPLLPFDCDTLKAVLTPFVSIDSTATISAQSIDYAASTATLAMVDEEDNVLVYEPTSPLDTIFVEITDTAYNIDAYGVAGRNHYRLQRDVSDNALLRDITIGGVSLQGFYDQTYTYQVVIPELQAVQGIAADNAAIVRQALLKQDDTHYVAFIQVTASDGITTLGYTVGLTIKTLRSTALLTGITANDANLPDFVPTQFDYTLNLPAGSAMPSLSATVADGATAQTTITQTDDHNQIVSYLVTSENGENTNTYTIHIHILPSSVATIDAIYYGTETINPFLPTLFNYDIVLPHGTQSLPEVTADLSESHATMTQSTDGMVVTIVVTAEDGVTTNTYTLTFSVAKGTDASLSAIYVRGDAVPAFDAETQNYTLSLPFGTDVPTAADIVATTTDSAATYSVSATSDLVFAINVQAEDGMTSRTYQITFNWLPSTASDLIMIYLDTDTLSGFVSDEYEYIDTLAYGAPLPTVTWLVADSQQVVDTVWTAQTLTITVTAGDAVTVSEYMLTFVHLLSPENHLASILVNGTLIDGFHADTMSYVIEYPVGTDSTSLLTISDIVATPVEPDAVVTLQQQGTAIVIIVTAPNGDIRAYSIEQHILLSAEARLSMIYLDSLPITNFHPDTLTYSIRIEQGAALPAITASALDTLRADVEYGMEQLLEDGSKLIEVDGVAQDGSRQTYSLYFVPANWIPQTDVQLNDCLFFRVPGTNIYRAVTISIGVKVAIYSLNGNMITIMDVPVLDVNSVDVLVEADGSQSIVEGSVPTDAIGADYTAPNAEPFLYVFYNTQTKKVGPAGKCVLK